MSVGPRIKYKWRFA